MDFSLVAPRGNKRKPKKVKIYLDTVWFTLPAVSFLKFQFAAQSSRFKVYNKFQL